MSKVRKNFNNASANYNDHAFLQKEIANRLSEKLNVISIDPKIVIDLGSGTGLLSKKISEIFPNTNLVCGIGPSAASVSKITPSAIPKTLSTSPPKSACPGVSTIFIR